MAFKVWSTQETLTSTDLNANFALAVTTDTAQAIAADKTFNDNVNVTLGTGGDADLYYDGTDVILDPQVVGSGVFRVLNEAEVRGDAGAAGILTLSTAETTVVDGDKLGQIDFQAPLEANGTDSILVAASIWAEADDTFSAANNDADLVFAVAESETAAERMRLSYDGSTTALSFTTATAIDTGGNNALTLNAGTGSLTVTAGDMTLYDDNNNADASVSIGTSATERLEMAVLNGGANKTAEEVRFTTYTASATADHGQFGFYVDETLIANIDDGGINLPSGKVFSVNGTDIAFDSTAAISLTNTLTVGVDDTGHDVKFFGASPSKYWQWDESADAMIVVGNATIGTLTAEGDGTLHVHTATAGTVAASTLGDDLIVENSTNAGISILTPNSAIGGIYFGDPQSHYAGQIYYDHANTWMQMRAEDAIWRFNSDGTFLLNETSNANMTVGLTINQGANDNQIACFKSSDINHGWSVNGIGFAHESDDFFSISKASGTIGGVALSAVAEDAAQDSVMYLETIGGTANTGKTTSSRGLISLDTAEHSGSAAADVTANGNVVSISARKSGSWQVVWIVDEDGDYHYDGADGGAFDSYADAELVRAVSLSTSDPAQIARSRWDDMVRYNKDDLVEAKIIGEVTPEEEAQGHRGLVNGAQVQRLHTGAIWQNHVDMLELREVADDLRAELDAERSQRMALEARLNLIEQKGRN